jgi:hypothetical protein
MTKTLTSLVVLLLVGCAAPVADPGVARLAVSEYPDPSLTPGVLCTRDDKDYDGDRYPEEIPHCKRNVTRHTKVVVAAQYGVSEDDLVNYQIDHFYPLGLGGSNDPGNLWPLIYDDARAKAKIEDELYLQLRDGQITQAQAIDEISHWRDML